VSLFAYFREVVLVDAEFRPLGNGSVVVRCVCAWELRSGRKYRLWIDRKRRCCPYPTDGSSVFVAHYSSAEVGVHHALGWPIPVNIVDTCIEFSAVTCGLRRRGQTRSLVDALKYFHLDSLDLDTKKEMRELALVDKANRAYTPKERRDLLSYCWEDVAALKRLLPKLEPHLCANYRRI
jgi:DNA polymerase-1